MTVNTNTGKNYLLITAIVLITIAVIASCAGTVSHQEVPNPGLADKHADNPRKLLVFMDGTANDHEARTNVRRLFEMVAAVEDPEVLSFYLEGVGTGSNPLTGSVLGRGMKKRVLKAYEFLAEHHRSNINGSDKSDRIFIFGFSRGALQARTLAGLLSYAGLPPGGLESDRIHDLALELWKYAKNQPEIDPDKNDFWAQQFALERNHRRPPFSLPGEGRENFQDFRYVDVSFLGVWDTVPAAFFTDWNEEGPCNREDGTVRYKTRAYPPILRIAHAMSLDERRSRYKAITFPARDIQGPSEVIEVWFPGAHADVGGGYSNSNMLAGVSLNWMLELLDEFELFGSHMDSSGNLVPFKPRVKADYAAMSHKSISGSLASLFSHDEIRHLPENPVIHESVCDRAGTKTPHNQPIVEEYIYESRWSGKGKPVAGNYSPTWPMTLNQSGECIPAKPSVTVEERQCPDYEQNAQSEHQ